MTIAQMLLAVLLLITRDDWVNPATMGANALPTQQAESPWSAADNEASLGGAFAWGRRYDHSFVPTFRLAAPFGRWVTAFFEGQPVELWWSSPETRVEWALPRDQGLSKADIKFGVKLLLFDGSKRGLPAVGFRTLTKTTTGKDYDARRFTNAPAYLLDVLVGERWTIRETVIITVFGGIGFWAWQQGSSAQNDAVAGNLALTVQWLEHGSITMDTRGMAGWQSGDKTIVQSMRVLAEITPWVGIAATCNLGFLSAPRLEGRLDFVFRVPQFIPWLLE